MRIEEDAAEAKASRRRRRSRPTEAHGQRSTRFVAGNKTRDDIPSHLIVGKDVDAATAALYASPARPGSMKSPKELRVNAPNCVDRKATDASAALDPARGGSGPKSRHSSLAHRRRASAPASCAAPVRPLHRAAGSLGKEMSCRPPFRRASSPRFAVSRGRLPRRRCRRELGGPPRRSRRTGSPLNEKRGGRGRRRRHPVHEVHAGQRLTVIVHEDHKGRSSPSTSGTTSAARTTGKTGFAPPFEHLMFQGSRTSTAGSTRWRRRAPPA